MHTECKGTCLRSVCPLPTRQPLQNNCTKSPFSLSSSQANLLQPEISWHKVQFCLAVNTMCLHYKDFCKPSFDLRTPRISVMMMMMMMIMIIIIIIIIIIIKKMNTCTSWRHIGEWRSTSFHSEPRHCMKVCDHFEKLRARCTTSTHWTGRWPHSRCGRYAEQKNLWPVPRIGPRFLGSNT